MMILNEVIDICPWWKYMHSFSFPSGYLRGDRCDRRRAERRNGHRDLHVCVRSKRQHRGDAAAEERGQVNSQPSDERRRRKTAGSELLLSGGLQVRARSGGHLQHGDRRHRPAQENEAPDRRFWQSA